jgi:hypothetical protein
MHKRQVYYTDKNTRRVVRFPQNLFFTKENEPVNLQLNLIYKRRPHNPKDSFTPKMATAMYVEMVGKLPLRGLNPKGNSKGFVFSCTKEACMKVSRLYYYGLNCSILLLKTPDTAALRWLLLSTYKTILHLL